MIITALKKKTMMTSESDEEVAPRPPAHEDEHRPIAIGGISGNQPERKKSNYGLRCYYEQVAGGGMPENADESVSRCRHKQSESKKAEKNHKART